MTESPDHEAKCLRCGRCCRLTIHTASGVRITFSDAWCPAHSLLGDGTSFCTVYATRHTALAEASGGFMRCLTFTEGIRKAVFPMDCPYSTAADIEPSIYAMQQTRIIRTTDLTPDARTLLFASIQQTRDALKPYQNLTKTLPEFDR